MRAGWTGAVVVSAGLVLGGCTGSDAPAEPAVSPEQALASVTETVDAATSVHLVLTATGLPEDVSGVVGADGVGTPAPAFQGTLQLVVAGSTVSSDVTALDGEVYAVLPFTSGPSLVDPAEYGAPDPASLFAPGTGLSALLPATQDVVAGEQTRSGSEVLTSYSGTLPGTAVADLLVVGDRDGTFDVTYGVVEESSQLRTVALTGPFYPGTTSTYDLVLDEYGAPVEISQP